jgi:hypothetical protein
MRTAVVLAYSAASAVLLFGKHAMLLDCTLHEINDSARIGGVNAVKL